MKIYIATSWLRKDEHNRMRDLMAAAGHELTFDWSLVSDHQESAKLKYYAEKETEAITKADALIVLLPGRLGTHVEIGLAIAAGVPIYMQTNPASRYRIDGENPACVFYSHSAIQMKFRGSIAQFAEILIERFESHSVPPRPDTFERLAAEIADWSDETFGDRRNEPIARLQHLSLEVDEVVESPYDASEYADCMILLVDAARSVGIDAAALLQAVRDKHEVNKGRKWNDPDKEGIVRHLGDMMALQPPPSHTMTARPTRPCTNCDGTMTSSVGCIFTCQKCGSVLEVPLEI